MCGLVGVAGKVTNKEEKAFKTLLHLDVLRGEHSTGILSVNNNDHMVLKKLGTPTDLKEYKGYDTLFRRSHKILMGHNRHATQGAISAINAHPFEFDTLIGMHNGTLRNQKDLPDSHLFEVDSENLYHAIEKIGLGPAIKKTRGAYSLTWYNKEEETLNFLRNSERPMHMCMSKDGQTMFWASEPWMLSVALSREGIEYTDITETEVDKHYSFELDMIKWGAKIVKPTVRHIEPAPSYTVVTSTKKSVSVQRGKHESIEGTIKATPYGHYVHPSNRHFDYIIMRSDEAGLPIHVRTKKGSDLWDSLRGADAGQEFELELWPLTNGIKPNHYSAKCSSVRDASIIGHQGKKLTMAEFKEASKGGCCCCGDPIEKPSQVREWLYSGYPVCNYCFEGDYEDLGGLMGNQ